MAAAFETTGQVGQTPLPAPPFSALSQSERSWWQRREATWVKCLVFCLARFHLRRRLCPQASGHKEEGMAGQRMASSGAIHYECRCAGLRLAATLSVSVKQTCSPRDELPPVALLHFFTVNKAGNVDKGQRRHTHHSEPGVGSTSFPPAAAANHIPCRPAAKVPDWSPLVQSKNQTSTICAGMK